VGNGYKVLEWLEEAVATRGFIPPPVIDLHTGNQAVYTKMLQAIESIERLAARNLASRRGTALKVYLDDSRETPEGWVRTYTSSETIEILQGGHVLELSLDHHLGNDADDDNGFEVLRWLEEQVRSRGFKPPDRIEIHTGDSEARVKMEAAVKRIHDLWREQQGRARNESEALH
jgi:hypothetical protein